MNILNPDLITLGEKDFQQLAVLRRMVRDLSFPVKILAVPTVRDADGLALSSRNQYLSVEERRAAPVLRKALLEARGMAAARAGTSSDLVEAVRDRISQCPLARIDYVEAVDTVNLSTPTPATQRLLLAVAVFFGRTRLIDNITLSIK